MGITRLAGLTGLDRIGIPVYLASRPNAKSLSVSQGKGLTAASARVSALMEAVETWHAEQARTDVVVASENDFGTSSVLPGERLAFCAHSRYQRDIPIAWISAEDLHSGKRRWVPYELVHTDFTVPGPPFSGYFSASTNGLASGNHLVEAIVHATCELIERDGTTLWHLLSDEARADCALDPSSIDDEQCRTLLDKFDRAGVDIAIWDVTTDIGVCTFHALVIDRDPNGLIAEFGSGAHPHKSVALLRALTEAAQARATFISGARDDFDPSWYQQSFRRRRWARARALVEQAGRAIDFGAASHVAHGTLEADQQWLLERLQGAGIIDVTFIDLSDPRFDIPVVRVVAAGLEGPMVGGRDNYVMGERATAMVRESAPLLRWSEQR